jgi:hypothetical protein
MRVTMEMNLTILNGIPDEYLYIKPARPMRRGVHDAQGGAPVPPKRAKPKRKGRKAKYAKGGRAVS